MYVDGVSKTESIICIMYGVCSDAAASQESGRGVVPVGVAVLAHSNSAASVKSW